MTNDNNHGDSKTNKNQNQTSRRSILKAISAGSIFVGASGLVSAGSDEEYVEVTIAEYKGEPQETEEVPESWLNHNQESWVVADNLAEDYLQKGWCKEITRRPSNNRTGGMQEIEIAVKATDRRKARNQMPNRKRGFNIKIEEWEGPGQDECDFNVSCVAGGSTMRLRRIEDQSLRCLAATCPIEVGNQKHLLHCAHGFTTHGSFTASFCDINPFNQYVGQGSCSSDRYFGEVRNVDLARDVVTIRQNPNSTLQGMANTIEGELDRNIRGHITQVGVDILMSNNRIVYQRGRSTCTTNGLITAHGNRQRCGETFREIRFSTGTSGGDSGGPHYHAPGGSDSLNILAPHRGRRGDWADGAAAYQMNAIHGWEFGITPQCSR